MTAPDLAGLAAPYALDALSDTDRDHVEAQLTQSAETDAFFDEVRAIREVMATLSAVTAAEPPAALRSRVLAAAEEDVVRTLPRTGGRWRAAVLAVAAALVIGLGAVGLGLALRPPAAPSTAQQIFAAPDVRTVSGDIPVGGTATLVFSHDRNAAVLVMNNVPPPTTGTVYQMWLVGAGGARSAGTMDAGSVSPSTTAVVPDLGDSTELAFTVEPGTGSPQPTGAVFARLPLA